MCQHCNILSTSHAIYAYVKCTTLPILDSRAIVSCMRAEKRQQEGVFLQGRLLQLRLPCEVRPDSSKAERSAATGHLLLTMPKEDLSGAASNPAYTR